MRALDPNKQNNVGRGNPASRGRRWKRWKRERGYREMRGRLGELREERYLSPSGPGHV